jgi:hypothetical protein
MWCDVKVQDATAIMADDKEAVPGLNRYAVWGGATVVAA